MNPKFVVAAAFVAGVMLGGAGLAWTQGTTAPPVASVGAAADIPGAHELPDRKMTCQVDLWAMTTMVNLQLRGYVRIGG